MVVFAFLVNELKVTRVDSDKIASVFDKHLLAVLAKYFGWSMPFSAVHALIVDRVPCDIFDATRCLALRIASRLLLTILLTGWPVSADAFLFIVDGSFRFLPVVS